ncbi:MAG: Gfo/Idh/MocA family oxidoreductase [Isosphaeraceae bacterium]
MAAPEVVPERLGAALIGGGFIGPVHAEALRRIGIPIVGVLGSNPDRARPLASRLGIRRVYQNLDDLLNDPDVVVVHIASPNQAHLEQARSVLRSGRHVLCEKPLATGSSETNELRNLAATRPRQASAVNYNVRFYPLCHEIRERVARGDLGRILSVSGSYTQDWLLYPEDYNWRVEPDSPTSLRALADIGTHWMDLAQFLTGQTITTVMADLATFHQERFRPLGPSETFAGPGAPGTSARVKISTEDYGAVLFHMDEGAHGVFHVSQAAAGRKNRLSIELAGTEGALAWESERPDELWIGHRNAPNQLLVRDPSLLTESARAISHYPGGHAEGFPDSFKQLALRVYHWIGGLKAGENPPAPSFPTFDDGHREVLLCEAIARSARERSWVLVPDA